jgi:hypothetical protein
LVIGASAPGAPPEVRAGRDLPESAQEWTSQSPPRGVSPKVRPGSRPTQGGPRETTEIDLDLDRPG